METSIIIDNALVEACGHAAHEVNRAYSRHLGNDNSHAAWDALSPERKCVVEQAVIGILYHAHTPKQSHDAWDIAMRAQGWRRADVKDVAAKTHPCLTPFDDLPIEQQYKDRLFFEVVKSVERAMLMRPGLGG